jgi:mRNA interferase MazF
VSLESSDFSSGGLLKSSRIRPARVFTANESLILYRAGHVHDQKVLEVLERLVAILTPK